MINNSLKNLYKKVKFSLLLYLGTSLLRYYGISLLWDYVISLPL